jgi:acetyl-CoA C-acetyltransferase
MREVGFITISGSFGRWNENGEGRMSIKDRVAIIGVGATRFGENFEMTYQDMALEAVYEAYEDAGLDTRDMEAAWLGTLSPALNGLEGDAGASLAEPLNFYPRPVTRVSAYCCTGMEAIRNAAFSIASGEYKMVLAVGVEKMREVTSRGSLVARHILETHPVIAKGRTAPGVFAPIATRYFYEYGYSRETLAKVAVKNHYNGSLNPKAHFRSPITEETVLKAPMVVDPLGLFDCCPTTDGAAAAILTTPEIARDLKKDYTLIKGIGLAVTQGYFSMPFQEDNDFLGFRSTREAAAMAYRQAGIKDPRKEIDVAEVHDCFTITELVNYEDLGFCGRGEGGRLISEGITALNGELPVNTSGGLKSCGHPVGATGVRMVVDIVNQMRGRSGKRQLRKADVGLAHTLGGPGAIACVFVLGKP